MFYSAAKTPSASPPPPPPSGVNEEQQVLPPTYIPGQAVPKNVAAKAKEIAKSRTKTSNPIISKTATPIPIVNLVDLPLGKLLGTGSYSSAYNIVVNGDDDEDKNNNKPRRILKKLKHQVQQNPLLFASCAADLVQEANILAAMMPHEHILNIYGWGGPDMLDSYLMGNPSSCFLILEELQPTTLEAKLKEWQTQSNSLWYMIYEETTTVEYQATLKEKCKHIHHMADAIHYLHQHSVLHRDLKPANIGFDQNGVLKVFDFDLSRVLPKNNGDELYQMTAKVGSPRYMAPEVKQGRPYNLKADLYSLGILIYQILTLEVPLQSNTSRDWSTNNKYIPMTWSTELRQVLGSCLIVDDIVKRPSMQQILSLMDKELVLLEEEEEEQQQQSSEEAE